MSGFIKFLIFILFLVLAFAVFTAYYAFRFRNRFTFNFIIGKPGTGKTTTMVKLAHEYTKKGWTVYANVDIPNTYRIDDSDITKYELKEYSVLLIDEIALIFNNRNFAKFTDEQRRWWKTYRHRKIKIYAFSQALDVDKSVRLLLTKIYICVNYFGVYTILKEVKRKFPVISKDKEGESQITDEYRVSPFFMAPFGARKFVFIPRWAKYFNSFEVEKLPVKEFQFIEKPITKKLLKKKVLLKKGKL